MSHQNFILAAFAVAALGIGWLILSSFIAMRRSEALADDMRDDG